MSETTTGEPAQLVVDAGAPVESPRRREIVGIVRERAPRDGRVAVVPEGVATLRAAGLEERRAILSARAEEVGRRLARHDAARNEASSRRTALEDATVALARLARSVQASVDRLEATRTRLAVVRDRQGALEHRKGLGIEHPALPRLGQHLHQLRSVFDTRGQRARER